MTFHFTEHNHSVTKAYSFKKGDIGLTFNLRVDKKTELLAFENLLVDALDEVRSDITEYENNK
jgi:hypothetical protein